MRDDEGRCESSGKGVSIAPAITRHYVADADAATGWAGGSGAIGSSRSSSGRRSPCRVSASQPAFPLALLETADQEELRERPQVAVSEKRAVGCDRDGTDPVDASRIRGQDLGDDRSLPAVDVDPSDECRLVAEPVHEQGARIAGPAGRLFPGHH